MVRAVEEPLELPTRPTDEAVVRGPASGSFPSGEDGYGEFQYRPVPMIATVTPELAVTLLSVSCAFSVGPEIIRPCPREKNRSKNVFSYITGGNHEPPLTMPTVPCVSLVLITRSKVSWADTVADCAVRSADRITMIRRNVRDAFGQTIFQGLCSRVWFFESRSGRR